MRLTLSKIADHLGGRIEGDPEVEVCHIRGIDEAGEGDLTFVANPKYRNRIETTKASAVLVSPGVRAAGKNLVIVDDPYVALARLLSFMYPDEAGFRGVSDKAFVADDAYVDKGVTIFPGVYVGHKARIEKDVVLYPGVSIGADVVIGEGSIFYSHVSVYRGCVIGKRVILHAGVVVGSDGFGFANPGEGNIKVPQVGVVQIDDECEIGANTTIDRGTLGKTWIKRGVKIDNLVQVGHNVVIGENSIVVAQVGISGSAKIGKGVLIGGQAGLVGHITVGDYAMIAAKSGIHKNVASGTVVSGYGQMPHRDWLRMQATLPKLPEMRKNMLSLLQRIGTIEQTVEKMNER